MIIYFYLSVLTLLTGCNIVHSSHYPHYYHHHHHHSKPIHGSSSSSSLHHHEQSLSNVSLESSEQKLFEPIVHTEWATIKGVVFNKLGRNISVFYGIPFAEPPIGKLRYRDPVPVRGRYNGIYDSTYTRPACMQSNYEHNRSIPEETISEDCLYLNIWVPHVDEGSHTSSDYHYNQINLHPLHGDHGHRLPPTKQKHQKLPVYFYIYGSQLKKSSATHKNNRGGILAALGGIIVVNVNYRLGAFGFAYGGDPQMPGNAALYDILLALEWTRDNIAAFGGDPERITIGGSSIGSELAAILALSPIVSPFLFDQVMMMSIVPIRPTAIEDTRVALNKTKSLAVKLGCGEYSPDQPRLTDEQIECMRQVNASAIAEIHADKELTMLGSCPDFAFMPIYGEDMMPLPPDEYLIKGQVRRYMNLLIGSDRNDDIESENYEPQSRDEAEDWLDELLLGMIKPKSNITSELEHIYDYYFDSVADNDTYALKDSTSRLIGDYLFQCPILLFTEKWALYDQIHLYYNVYTHDRYANDTKPKHMHGPFHGDANWMFFGRPFLNPDKYSDRDREVSHKMINILSGYVRSGRLPWPPVLVRGEKTLPIQWIIDETVNPKKIEVNPKVHICRFWGKIYNVFY